LKYVLQSFYMTEDEHIQRHLEIAQQVYERLLAEGKFDEALVSPNSESSAS